MSRLKHYRLTSAMAAAGLVLCTTNGIGAEFQAVVKKTDVERQTIVVTAGQQERMLRVPGDVKVIDVQGQEDRDGLRAKGLREGVSITLVAERKDGKLALREIRLGTKHAPAAVPVAASSPAIEQDTSRLVPLTDLGPNKYEGFQGGLYPEGRNTRPAGHEKAGMKLAQEIQPLDAGGKPAKTGKVVLLGIGFSNTVQAFAGLMRAAERDRELNPRLVLVNGAVGGMSAAMVQNPDDEKRGTQYWASVDERLKSAGAARAQVQAVWIKETNPAPHEGGFPKYTQTLEEQLVRIVQVLHQRFPNLKLAYLSSRTYGGWAIRPGGGTGGNSEPYSYQSGFAVKWLVERQLQGDAALNFDPAKGPVSAPWLSWAAYLWTRGKTPRGDGVFFTFEDFQERDHMHESLQGQEKVGRLLLQFFKTDPTSRPWFVGAKTGDEASDAADRKADGR